VISFGAYAARKVQEAHAARLAPLSTEDDRSARFNLTQVASPWTRELYDGPYHLPASAADNLPVVSLVFVRSRDHNTGADNPEDLGGGPADKHLIYEGLSRVAADAVLAGARTVDGADVFFSVWHRELVALRAALGLPRHPAQVVVTGSGRIDPDRCLVFGAPEVPVFVLADAGNCAPLADAASRHPSVEIVPIHHRDLRGALQHLRARGIRRISAVGGRTIATSLLDAGLVHDLLLTTTARDAGQPGTPYYVGKSPPTLHPIVRKRGTDPEIVVEHFLIMTANGLGLKA
jgi:riboflavin biosynthesis pyrimidine reductase